MEDEVRTILLNGMPVVEFIAYYLAGLFGAFVWFLIKTLRAISKDPETAGRFQWRYFWRGFVKFILTLIILPWVVIYFEDYGPFIMQGLFGFPQLAEGQDLLMEINAGSAALIGFFLDMGIRKLTHHRFKKLMP